MPDGTVTLASKRNALLCAAVTALCIAGVYPVASVPFSDDFSYTKTALEFARSGHFVYNGWATAMLGWQVLWGALFIKVFGFSFTIVRLSVAPIAMATVYLFHQILVRFGIHPKDAVLGALTLGASPLFLFSAASYMTDVPGLFVLVLCFYMCQRALHASSHTATLVWLASAALVNIAGGTVRQTSWLGALVIVPSTAWILRKHRGVPQLAPALFAISLAGIYACIHWANRQPFFVPEPILVERRFFRGFWYLLGEYGKAILCLLLVLLPLVAGFLPPARKLSRGAAIRIATGTGLFAVALILRARHGMLANWVMPWLIPVLQTQGMVEPDVLLGGVVTIPLKLRAAISVLVVAAGLMAVEQVMRRLRQPRTSPPCSPSSSRTALFFVGPFLLAYLLLMAPRAATSFMQDRYLLGIIPPVILLLLLSYERWFGPQLPVLSTFFLAIFTLYAIGADHNLYANLRANQLAVGELDAAGIPRTAIVEGFAADGWTQIDLQGYFNSANMVLASRYYNPHVPPWPLPEGCASYLPQAAEPVIHPRYFITGSLTACLAPTDFPRIQYNAWLPPFHRTVFVEQLRAITP